MKKKLKEQEKESSVWLAEFENLKRQRIEDEKVRAECESINKQFRSIVDIESNNLHKLELRIGKLEEDIGVKDRLLARQGEEIARLREEVERLRMGVGVGEGVGETGGGVEDMLVESTIIPHDYLKGLKKEGKREEEKGKPKLNPKPLEEYPYRPPSSYQPPPLSSSLPSCTRL